MWLATKNRLHLDLATTSAEDQAELVTRLRPLGATPADVGQGDVPWVVLGQPEGNENPGDRPGVQVGLVGLQHAGGFWGEVMEWTVPWTCLQDPEGHEFCVLGRSSLRGAGGHARPRAPADAGAAPGRIVSRRD